MSTSSYFMADSQFSSNYAPSDNTQSFVQIVGTTLNITDSRTPASASDTGIKGEICYDTNFVYVCTATNTWKRLSLSSW